MAGTTRDVRATSRIGRSPEHIASGITRRRFRFDTHRKLKPEFREYIVKQQDMEPNAERKWLTKSEIASHIGCDIRTIGNLMRRRVLPFVKIRGLLRFQLAECEEALRKYRAATLSERHQTVEKSATNTANMPSVVVPPPSETVPGANTNILGAIVAQGEFGSPQQMRTEVADALDRPGLTDAKSGTWILLLIQP